MNAPYPSQKPRKGGPPGQMISFWYHSATPRQFHAIIVLKVSLKGTRENIYENRPAFWGENELQPATRLLPQTQ